MEGDHFLPLRPPGCQERHSGVFLWGALSTESILTSESLRLEELETIPFKCHLCGVPSLLVPSHG